MKAILIFLLITVCSPGLNAQDEEYAPHIVGRPAYGIIDSGIPVKIIEKEGMAILDGDIMLGPIENVEISERQYLRMKNGTQLGGNMRFQASRRWLGSIVPYSINATLPNASRIAEAIAHWEALTPLRFVLRTNQTDYVLFNPDPTTTCSSSVGRVGGRQIVLLAERCNAMIVVHEIGHAIGFYHEQSRLDRDNYVKIIWDAIEVGKTHNFDMFDPVTTRDFGIYDYGSIMHYSASSFPKIPGQITIVAPQPIGQRDGLSTRDVQTAIYFYTPQPIRVNAAVESSWILISVSVSPGQRYAAGAILFRVGQVSGTLDYTSRATADGMVSVVKFNVNAIVNTGDSILEVFNV